MPSPINSTVPRSRLAKGCTGSRILLQRIAGIGSGAVTRHIEWTARKLTFSAYNRLAIIERSDAIAMPLLLEIVLGTESVGDGPERRRPLKILKSLSIVMLCGALVCNAQDLTFAKELTFQEIFASRQNDTRAYILLGSGWLRTIRFGNPGQFVSKWVEEHPAATIKPISRMFTTNTRTKKTEQIVYIWVEDGEMSLNVDLVRAGVFPGAVMADMVDNFKGLNELLKDPKLAAAKAQIEKERAAAPQDRTERLVSEDDYKRRMRSIEVAETQAHKEKLGIWSDSMKADREEEGYP
jgi:hypothetical protein